MGLLIKDRIEDISFEEWDDVLARSVRPSPFLSRRFLVPWVKTFAAGRPLRIARWERGGRAEGFLFLCRRAGAGGGGALGGLPILPGTAPQEPSRETAVHGRPDGGVLPRGGARVLLRRLAATGVPEGGGGGHRLRGPEPSPPGP